MLLDAFAVLRFHFGKLKLLLGREERGDLPVGLGDAVHDTAGGFLPDGLHVGAGFFDQRCDLRPLLVSQMQARLQPGEHVTRKLLWLGWTKEDLT